MLPFAATQMDLENFMVNEIIQTEVKIHMILLIVGYKTEGNTWTNKKNKQTDTRRHRQQCGGYQNERGLGIMKGKGRQICGDGRRLDFGQ